MKIEGKKVHKKLLVKFFRELSKRVKYPVTVFLTGGSALTYLGYREFSFDIDFGFETSNSEDFLKAIERTASELGVHVEAGVDIGRWGFLPMEGYKDRAKTVGRIGSIVLKALDAYDIAFSKIDRFTEQDWQDIKMLFQNGIISIKGLKKEFKWRYDNYPVDLRKFQFKKRFQFVVKELVVRCCDEHKGKD